MIIKRESFMIRAFKNTAAAFGILVLLLAMIAATALTVEFLSWLFDLHYNI